MSAVYLIKGTCTLGRVSKDINGNIKEEESAKFVEDVTGGSIAVGLLNTETMQPVEPVHGIYGDWDAAGYLEEALKLLQPNRKINIPDIKSIIQTAYREDGHHLLCDYCQSVMCRDCIVTEWREEIE